ncbi:MAG: hypothetical protein Q8P89_03885, partial [bacterium]|nr:hypothetical protein [bacterium]
FLAAASALFLAFSLEFWQFANRAEVFALNDFFGAALTLTAVSWWEKVWNQGSGIRNQGKEIGEQEDKNHNSLFLLHNSTPKPSRKTLQKYSFLTKYLPDEALGRLSAYQPPAGRGGKRGSQTFSVRLLYLLAFIAGLALTHHQTSVLLFPALFFVLLLAGAKYWWKREVLIKLVLCFLLGVLPYFSLIPMSRANPPEKWGDPSDITGVIKSLARSDYGTFSPYAQNPAEAEGKKQPETPVTQQIFYLKSLNQDFTFLGLILAFLGFLYLFRRQKKVGVFLFLAFFFSGPFFFGFANYTLDSGFYQAVAKRFQMLPNIFFTLFLAFGFFFLWEKFRGLNLDFRQRKNTLVGLLLMATLTLTFFFPLVRNFKYADNRANSLTLDYARDSLAPTPKNAVILISGDVTTFAFEFWQILVEEKNDRIIFSPGLLYLDWYVARLKKNYPDLTIPPTQPGRLQPSTTEIIETNWEKWQWQGRPIYTSPELARYDPEVGEKYVLWPKHLLFLVKKKGDDLKLEPYREENEALWQAHDLKLFEKTRKNSPLLEYAMVPEYARHHFNLGAVFENVHLYDDAIKEYEKALEIHPGFPDPYKNLGRIYGFELENKDYEKAFANFNTFLTTALPSQEQDVEAVKGAMGVLYEEMLKEATQSGQLKEASEAGKVATPSAEASRSGGSFGFTQDKATESGSR